MSNTVEIKFLNRIFLSESEPESDGSPVSSPPSTPTPARPSFLSRLASKRRTLPTLTPTVVPVPA